MPAWLLSLIFAIGKPALIAILRRFEVRFPGITEFAEAIIRFLEGSPNKAEAVEKLHKHCEGLFCPAELKGE